MDSPKPKLPVIELKHVKDLNPGTSLWASTSKAVREGLESYGCLVIEYEEMSSELHEAMFGALVELFSLPMETKRKHTSELPGFGYGGHFSTMPLFEYFGIEEDDAADLQSKTNFASLLWPEGNHHFCETLNSYCTLLSGLERTVMRMLASSYGLEKYYEPLMASSLCMTRPMRYHSPGENKASIGIMAHRDKSFMAVIGTNDVAGLEIETRDGDWIGFEPSPHRFIFVVGEALMAWSNGRVYCPLHKVVARGREEKYSLGVFSFIRGVMEVPQELADDENPLRFKPFQNLDFLDYCKEGGPKMSGAIHEFCGL